MCDDIRLQVAPLATDEQADARHHGDAEQTARDNEKERDGSAVPVT